MKQRLLILLFVIMAGLTLIGHKRALAQHRNEFKPYPFPQYSFSVELPATWERVPFEQRQTWPSTQEELKKALARPLKSIVIHPDANLDAIRGSYVVYLRKQTQQDDSTMDAAVLISRDRDNDRSLFSFADLQTGHPNEADGPYYARLRRQVDHVNGKEVVITMTKEVASRAGRSVLIGPSGRTLKVTGSPYDYYWVSTACFEDSGYFYTIRVSLPDTVKDRYANVLVHAVQSFRKLKLTKP